MAYGGTASKLKRYGVLYRSGAASSAFYVLTHGAVSVASEDAPAATLNVERGAKQGLPLGLESLSGGMRRQATVSALEACELVTFPTRDLQLSSDRLQRLAEKIFADTAVAALRATPVFMDLTAKQLQAVAGLFELEQFQPGQAVFTEGGHCDKLFILLNGSVGITKRGQAIANLDATVGESLGGHPFFGTAGLLEADARRPYDVGSRTPSNVLVLSLGGFKRFLKQVPDFKERLTDFADMRRKAWELECGLSLEVGFGGPDEAETSPINRLEAALVVQASMRSMLARRQWSSRKDLQDIKGIEKAEAAAQAEPTLQRP